MQYILIFISILMAGCHSKMQQNQNVTASPKIKSAQAKAAYYHVPASKLASGGDHAPEGLIPTSFNKVVPKDEPMSRYGNPSTYKVRGKTYEVLRSSKGYKSKGVASWYASKFHDKHTSSRSGYDMYSLTAAHKTLPIPTYLKVKNLDNGKEAIVKVNDRGPFHEDRILDLSYGAAVKLGVFPRGTANVEIEAVSNPGGQHYVAHYFLQAGAFSSQALANNLKVKIAKLSSSPVFIEKTKGRYVVRVGPLVSKGASEQLQVKLAHHGVKGSFITLG